MWILIDHHAQKLSLKETLTHPFQQNGPARECEFFVTLNTVVLTEWHDTIGWSDYRSLAAAYTRHVGFTWYTHIRQFNMLASFIYYLVFYSMRSRSMLQQQQLIAKAGFDARRVDFVIHIFALNRIRSRWNKIEKERCVIYVWLV